MIVETAQAILSKALPPLACCQNGRAHFTRYLLNSLSVLAGQDNPGTLHHPRFFRAAPALGQGRNSQACFERNYRV
jgi:hypothetical protein